VQRVEISLLADKLPLRLIPCQLGKIHAHSLLFALGLWPLVLGRPVKDVLVRMRPRLH
jgi:hypothetical protein